MADLSTSAKWFTARRLRIHGLILALCLWSVYIWNITTPGLLDRVGNLKGTDFLHFYTLGSLALTHRGADLYNMKAAVPSRGRARSGRRGHPLYAALSAAGFHLLRTLCPPVLSLRADPLAHTERAHLRCVLLRPLACLLQPPQATNLPS
jgi:hypothetical protein